MGWASPSFNSLFKIRSAPSLPTVLSTSIAFNSLFEILDPTYIRVVGNKYGAFNSLFEIRVTREDDQEGEGLQLSILSLRFTAPKGSMKPSCSNTLSILSLRFFL